MLGEVFHSSHLLANVWPHSCGSPEEREDLNPWRGSDLAWGKTLCDRAGKWNITPQSLGSETLTKGNSPTWPAQCLLTQPRASGGRLCSMDNSKSQRRDWVVTTGRQKRVSGYSHHLVSGHQGFYQTSSTHRERSRLSPVSIGPLLRNPDLTEGWACQSHQTTPQMRKWAWATENTRKNVQTAYSSLPQSFQNHLTP